MHVYLYCNMQPTGKGFRLTNRQEPGVVTFIRVLVIAPYRMPINISVVFVTVPNQPHRAYCHLFCAEDDLT